MDFAKLMAITGMTFPELKMIPKAALINIIAALENRLYGMFHTADVRNDIEYQIDCYNELMLTAR